MAQLRLGYPEIKKRGADLLQITITPAKLGPIYAKRFDLPFPYLCDQDQSLHRLFGLTGKGVEMTGLKGGLMAVVASLPSLVNRDQPSLLPYLPYLKKGVDPTMQQAMFLVGRDGKVHFRHVSDGHEPIPSNDALLRELAALS